MPNQINNHHEDGHPVSPLIINSLSKITGDLVLSSDVRVDGSVEGNITTSKSVIIGEDGHLKGNIKCNSLVVYGRIEGIAEVEGNTHLHESAVYVGRLNTGLISITKGCAINARINMDIPDVDFIPAPPPAKEVLGIPETAEVKKEMAPIVAETVVAEPKKVVEPEHKKTIEVKKAIDLKEQKEVVTEPKEVLESLNNNTAKKIIKPVNEPFVVAPKPQAPVSPAPAPSPVQAPAASSPASGTSSNGSSFLLSKLKGI